MLGLALFRLPQDLHTFLASVFRQAFDFCCILLLDTLSRIYRLNEDLSRPQRFLLRDIIRGLEDLRSYAHKSIGDTQMYVCLRLPQA